MVEGGQVMALDWDWSLVVKALPSLLRGLWVTVLATAGGMTMAMVLGLVFAVMRRSRARWVAWPAASVVEFIRNTPLLIQLFFVYYWIPDLGWNGPLITGILVLGVHYATYTSEVYRSGINAVPQGQWDAARALNFSQARTWLGVVLPQAIPPVIPALGNYLVAMFKDTPLLYAITVREMLSRAHNFNSRVGSYEESYTLVGVIFLVLGLLAATVIRQAERHWIPRQA